MLDRPTIRRLALIRYLYTIAVDQSLRPEPFAALAILTFHDAAELFLQLASEQLNVSKKSREFMAYFPALNDALRSDDLAQQASMQRLNNARVALKHHGTYPSRLDIEAFRGSVTSFFEDNTPLVFDIEFAAVSLVDIVSCERVRKRLINASALMEKGDLKGSIVEIAIAFMHLVDDYTSKVRTQFEPSSFLFGGDLRLYKPFHHHFEDRGEEQLWDCVMQLQEAVRILSLGLDYKRYVEFRMITPSVFGTLARGYGVTDNPHPLPLSLDHYRFCLDFVIDSAVRLQEAGLGQVTN